MPSPVFSKFGLVLVHDLQIATNVRPHVIPQSSHVVAVVHLQRCTEKGRRQIQTLQKNHNGSAGHVHLTP